MISRIYLKNGSINAYINKLSFDWLIQVESAIRDKIERSSPYTISTLAEEFNLSRRQLQRRIKDLTGLSPKQFQQEIALDIAKELLEKNSYENITAVALSSGFNNVTRFSEKFFDRFEKKPIDYFRIMISA